MVLDIPPCRTVGPLMREQELQDAIVDLAHALGYIVRHVAPARTTKGWRTPERYDGAGSPDLRIVGNGRMFDAEIKGTRGTVTAEQQMWIEWLRNNGGVVFVWWPKDWLSGDIEREMRRSV